MRKIWHVTMSVDGLIAGPADAMDWVFGYIPLDKPETKAMLEEAIRTTESVLSGKRSYNVGRKPGQRPRDGRRLERTAIRADEQRSQGRRGCVDHVCVRRHSWRDGCSARSWRQERYDHWRRRCAAVYPSGADRRDSSAPCAGLARRWRAVF
jgi:hypothetical protein